MMHFQGPINSLFLVFFVALTSIRQSHSTVSLSLHCNCPECTDFIWNTLAGAYTCGSRIDWLQSPEGGSLTEPDACHRVSAEFPSICGPMCDPSQCGKTRAPITPAPVYAPLLPPSSSSYNGPLYCFPSQESRVRYLNAWTNYTVEVKEGTPCGPGDNFFSRESVSVQGNELKLQFQKGSGLDWKAGEVRLISSNGEKFRYGTYSFHVKSVQVKDSAFNHTVVSNYLPSDLVLGLFTWDPTDRYDVHENWNHEVDIEMSQWGDSTIADMQFLVQPPGSPQQYRFFSGAAGTNLLNQSMHTHTIQWLPGSLYWESDAGGGRTHQYTTEYAITHSVEDFVQCLPANIEIRMNLWNMNGNVRPSGISDSQYAEVVIDNFTYTPSNKSYLSPGEFCSKHCQCEGYLGCRNGQCVSSTNEPTYGPTVQATYFKPSTMPSQTPSRKLNSIPSIRPTSRRSPSAQPFFVYCREKASARFLLSIQRKGKQIVPIIQTCGWLRKQNESKISRICTRHGFPDFPPAKSICKRTCRTCQT